MTQVSWLHAVPQLAMFLFLAGAFIFAIARRGDHSSAKTLAVLGLGILLFLRIASVVTNFAISQLASNDVMLYLGLYSIVSTLFYMVALSLLIAAAFSGRSDSSRAEEIADERIPVASKNPYTPPVN